MWGNCGLVVKNLPASAGDIRDPGSIPGWGRSSRRGHGNHSSILAWRLPRTEETGGLQTTGSQSRTRLNWLSTHTHTLMGKLYTVCLGSRDTWSNSCASLTSHRTTGERKVLALLHTSSPIVLMTNPRAEYLPQTAERIWGWDFLPHEIIHPNITRPGNSCRPNPVHF